MKKHIRTCFLLCLVCLFFTGCGNAESPPEASGSSAGLDASSSAKSTAAGSEAQPQVLVPTADARVVYSSDYAAIDASHTDQGYVMVRYLGAAEKVKLQILSPDGVTYTYLLIKRDCYETFPLTGGNGNYMISVYENVTDDKYAIVLSQDIAVTIENEFLPFLYPNQYVNFVPGDDAVTKAAQLAQDAQTDMDVVSNVFYYVVENITYDYEKAEQVEYGYLPDNSETLASGTGICFDFASLMTAMLRSRDIPTRLEVGYAGDAYHAWLSTYIPEKGWIRNIIQFDGVTWTLMDPTFASQSEGKEDVVGDGSAYLLKYVY